MKYRRREAPSDVMVVDEYAEGTLVKQGGRIKTWHKRFFVFHKGFLSYRKDARDTTKVLRKELVLNIAFAEKEKEIPFGLCITLKSGRALMVSAKNDEEAHTWYEVISDFLAQQQLCKEMNDMEIQERSVYPSFSSEVSTTRSVDSDDEWWNENFQ
ncbi:hypothetical protein Poli38472_006525 [Pythium oligandrum]|uniref:PH domain-containing protein n=1 Tax=Pythium oligandrum TaxID=41045 RepID=A0A8K1C4Y4_PYTOL|nr:hypothetical protein Poli38472_006525 [Pythium oligandrum]|eukprot:TMW56515.1 hypothetical protein Poli38472_006525 [Pythium oligandrum]